MRRTLCPCQSKSAPERGFTVIEFAVVMGILLIVVGAMLTVFESVTRSEAFVADRSQTLDELRLAMDRMTKEIRQATWIDPACQPDSYSDTLTMKTYVAEVPKDVTYQATGTTLVRVSDGGSVPIETELASTAIFSCSAQIVTMTLQAHPWRQPDTTVKLTSEVRLRNVSGS